MGDLSLFGIHLLELATRAEQFATVALSGGAAVIAWIGRQASRRGVAPCIREGANGAGLVMGGALGAALLAGLRVQATAFVPGADSMMEMWNVLVLASVTGAGAVGVSSLFSATAAYALSNSKQLSTGTE